MTEFGLAVLLLLNDLLLRFCVVGSYDRSGRSDKLIKSLAVQCVSCCLNTAVAYVVAVNSCGTTDTVRFGGSSLIADPWGTMLAQGGAVFL